MEGTDSSRNYRRDGFYLAQALSGHGCFYAHLKRFKNRDDESCRYCGSLVDNTEHTLFVWARWGVAREAVGRAVGAQLTPDTTDSLMLQSEQLIESFVTLVMKTRELDGHAERQQRGPVEIASEPAPAVLRLGQTKLSASSGEGIFYSSPGWRG